MLTVYFFSDPPSITQHLSHYTPTTAENNEMRRLWNSAQPICSLSEETLVPFLDKLRLGVGRRSHRRNNPQLNYVNFPLQDVSMETLEKVGAKVNLNLEQLILPCLTSKDDKFHGIKILSPNHSNVKSRNFCSIC